MKTNLTVTTDFATFTRTTARTYTHLVAVKGLKAEGLEATRLATIEYEQKQIRKYQRDLQDVPAARARGGWGDWFTTEWLQNAIVGCQEHVDRLQAVGPITEDQGDWFALGWCGRIDLARNLATSKQATSYRNVVIIDVATGQVAR